MSYLAFRRPRRVFHNHVLGWIEAAYQRALRASLRVPSVAYVLGAGAAVAEHADHVAETVARDDELGADHQDEGEGERGAHAVEDLGQRRRQTDVPDDRALARAERPRRPDQAVLDAADIPGEASSQNSLASSSVT